MLWNSVCNRTYKKTTRDGVIVYELFIFTYAYAHMCICVWTNIEVILLKILECYTFWNGACGPCFRSFWINMDKMQSNHFVKIDFTSPNPIKLRKIEFNVKFHAFNSWYRTKVATVIMCAHNEIQSVVG